MSKGSYSRNSKDTVKTTVEDEKIIEAFISRLESSEEAKKVLEEADDSKVFKARISYDIIHPYNGDDFLRYLTLGEDVTARTKCEVQYKGERKLYKGLITKEATEIFDPEALID